MRVVIAFEFGDYARRAIRSQTEGDGLPATHDELRSWMLSTINATAESVEAEYKTSLAEGTE